MAAAAKARGLQALALTEHAPEMPGNMWYFLFSDLDVVPRECNGVRLLMGAEVNIMNPDGEIIFRRRHAGKWILSWQVCTLRAMD